MKLNDEFFYCFDMYRTKHSNQTITVFVGTMETHDYANVMKDDRYTLTDPYRPEITDLPVKIIEVKPDSIKAVQCILYHYGEIK